MYNLLNIYMTASTTATNSFQNNLLFVEWDVISLIKTFFVLAGRVYSERW